MNKLAARYCFPGIAALVTVALTSSAHAQSGESGAADSTGTDAALEVVTVTGSHIRRANLESGSPILQVAAHDFDARGAVRAEELTNRLPQVTPARGGNTVEGTTAEINLRGLGAQRTLVLVNGHRLPYGSPLHLASDINQVPLILLENVEVLTGGASATYGSDALAGVVNFKLRDDFEGVRIQSTFSGYQHNNDNRGIQSMLREWEAANPGEYTLPDSSVWDGFSQKYSMALGMNLGGGRGNIAGYGTYTKTERASMADRDYSVCELGNTAAGNTYACRPSPVDDPASFVNTGAAGLPPEFRAIGGQFQVRQPYTGAPVTDRFNQNPYEPLLRPMEQYSFGVVGHYEVNEHFVPFIEANLYSITSPSDYSPSGIINNGILANKAGGINCDNPFLSAAQADFLCTSRGLSTAGTYDPVTGVYLGGDIASGIAVNYRTTEHGTRHFEADQSSFSLTTGARGKLAGPFEYSASLTYSSVELRAVFEGNSDVRDSQSMYAVIDRRVRPDGTPLNPVTYLQPACAINVDEDPTNDVVNCAPADFFSDTGPGTGPGPSAAALAFSDSAALRFGDTTMTNVVASVTGDLDEYGVRSPFASEGIGVALGVEHRENTLTMNSSTNPLLIVQNEAWAGDGGGPPVGGKTSVREVFGELYVPVIDSRTLFKELALDVGYRYSDYKGLFTTDTYKFGVNWLVHDAVRLRGSFQHAVRAPNVIELFSGQTRGVVLRLAQNPDGSFDPCSGTDPFASLEECARTGVLPQDYGSIVDNSFVGQLQGGNPGLGPEEGDTLVLGTVLEPPFVPGLTLSLDYFDIEIEGLVGVIDPNITLRQCMANGDPIFCNLIKRGVGGTLFATSDSYISTLNVNTGSLRTTGVDVTASYPVDLSRIFNRNVGDLSLSLTGTYLDKYKVKPLPTSPAEATFDCAGYHGFSCGHPKPVWRHTMNATWRTPWLDDLELGLTWRYIGEAEISRRSSNPVLHGTALKTQDLASRSYLDLSAFWHATDTVSLRAGVNNVLDKEPALTTEFIGGEGGRGNTYGGFYDYMGRLLFLTATLDF